MTVTIGLACSRGGCGRHASLPVGSQQFFSGQRLKDYFPKGWRVRTPKGEDEVALAYCPEHAEWSL